MAVAVKIYPHINFVQFDFFLCIVYIIAKYTMAVFNIFAGEQIRKVQQ